MKATAILSFVKHFVSGNPIRWLVLGGALLIAAITIGTTIMAGNFRERALTSAERELENTVLLLARHFDRQLSDFIGVEEDIATQIRLAGITSPAEFKARMSTFEMHEALKAKVGWHSDVAGVGVSDSDGVLINTSENWPPPNISVSDRGYFKAAKSGAATAPVSIELVRGRLSKEWETVIAYKITGPNGEFLGLLARAVRPASFEKFFESLALGDGASISILHRDGTLLGRYPHVHAMIGLNFKNAPVHQRILSKSDHGTTRIVSAIDGLSRLASVRALADFPIDIIATTTVSAALADWKEQLSYMVAAAGLSVLVIAGMLFFVVRKLSQQHQMEKQRLDTAVNNIPQGLVVYDKAARITVCNERYVEMFGLSPEVARPGSTMQDLIAHRKETGSFDGDVDEFCNAIMRNVALGKATRQVTEAPGGRAIQITNQPLETGGWVATIEDVTERERSAEQIAHMAHYDALTDLPNRVLFREQLEGALQRIQFGEQLAVLYIDIDEFKSVNDALGHSIGDELLKTVARRLRGCLSAADVAARLGGDEFAVIQTAVRNPSETTHLVERIYRAIREPYECASHLITTDASIGIALASGHGADLDQLLKNADLAMYAAKSAGRRTYRFFKPDMEAQVTARHVLEVDLRQAISDGALEVYYQPCVSLRDNRITGCEALLRWRHSERGMISPAEFIPIAEETGLINQLGEWVLMTACAEATTWPDDIRLAVNVSPVQFKSGTLALKILAALAASGLPASRLELEITEAVLIRDDEAALAVLHQLRAIGVRIALDDFGTGYSSLSYLQRFPFDKIKIDRCFIDDIAEPDGSSCIVQAVVNIAAARHMTATAEGVETKQQLELLRALGCAEMQGYLFSHAKPAAEIRQLFFSHQQKSAAVA
jgi:diguanylate cyclase (GGDEF)-like protein/PAS domain S-box-containing protein